MYKVGAFLIAVLVSFAGGVGVCAATSVAAASAVSAGDDGVVGIIKCGDVSDDGVGTAYAAHEFVLDSAVGDVSAYQWSFCLKDSSGEFVPVSAGDEATFLVDAVRSPENYFVSESKSLEGRVECTYTINGEHFDAMPFSISLDLKPRIISIDDVEKHYMTLDEYYLTFNVTYTGADCLKVKMEEDYSSGKRVYWSYEPNIAHVKTGTTTDLFYCWVTIEVQNEYGLATETLEFAPEHDNSGLPPVVDLTFIYLNTEENERYNYIRLYFSDLEGIDRLVLERLRDGLRLPSKIEIGDLKKGYFDTSIDMNTTFTAVAYNENGSTRGTPLYVPMKSTAGVEVVEDATAVVERIVVYDLSGRVVFDGTPETFGSEQLSSGVYVKKEVLKGGVSRTSKIVVR